MHLYGLIVGISILIGINYFSRHQDFLPKPKVDLFVFGVILSAIIGARTYHVVDNFSYYSQNPDQIIATWNGGLGIFGGIIGAFVFISVFSFIQKIRLLKIIDSISRIMPLCQAIGRLGNFANNEIPTWWVEAMWNVGLFLYIRRNPSNPTVKYLIGYGIIRFILEFFRDDTWVVGTIKIGQIISAIFIVFGYVILISGRKYRKL